MNQISSNYLPIRRTCSILILLGMSIGVLFAKSNKVGLVMSGGGAKGLTHIGVIKALEESQIPIDYVAGTSMGAIIASFYAMGYTVDEMIDLIKSENFMRWQTGTLDKSERYYFSSREPIPSIIEVKANITKIDSFQIQANLFPTNLSNPRQMNFAFMELYDASTAACEGNFDNLMVPFRCIGSDIYKKEAVVFSGGNLALAVRASMSFPFMFRPVVMPDGSVLYDGGIYNNFPVDVMEKDFNPGYMIGVTVSENPQKPDPRNIVKILENMIVQPTNYSINRGILLEFKWDNINMWDFSLIDELVQQGYDSTMAHIEEIKRSVTRRITTEKVAEKRSQFKNKVPPIRFDSIVVVGVSAPQRLFIEQAIKKNNATFDLDTFRKSYFALLSDEAIREIIPTATYNPKSGYYTLHLEVFQQDNIKVTIGGNLSSSTPNQAFLGIQYQGFSEFSQKSWLNFHFGRTYNGLNLGSRLDINNWLYLKPQIVLHQFDFYDDNRWFFQPEKMSFFTQKELYAKFSLGFPATLRSRFEIGVGYGFLSDKYVQDKQLAFEFQEYDKSNHSLFSLFFKIDANSLNSIMYPTSGRMWSIVSQFVGGWENFKSPSFPATSVSRISDLWFQSRGEYEGYFKLHRYFTLGLYGEAFTSWRGLLQNYTATIVQLPQFSPTPHSKVVFNEAFTASQYVAVGLKPIYTPKRNLQLRSEFYAFLPYKPIYRRADNTAYYGTPLSSIQFTGELSVVYNMKLASASVFVNYYSVPLNNWNIGFNIGILLFKEKFLE